MLRTQVCLTASDNRESIRTSQGKAGQNYSHGLSLCFTIIFLCLLACSVCLCLGSYMVTWPGFPGHWVSITWLHWISKDRLILWILGINYLGGKNLIAWSCVVQVYALCHFRSGCVWGLLEGSFSEKGYMGQERHWKESCNQLTPAFTTNCEFGVHSSIHAELIFFVMIWGKLF